MIAVISKNTTIGAANSFERKHAVDRPFVVQVNDEYLRKNNRIRRYIDASSAERAVAAMGYEVTHAA